MRTAETAAMASGIGMPENPLHSPETADVGEMRSNPKHRLPVDAADAEETAAAVAAALAVAVAEYTHGTETAALAARARTAATVLTASC